MTGHAACNLMPVVAANRIGTEEVVPCAENGNQSSALTFYGSSFITDATGEVVEQMDRVTEGFILHSFDLDELESERKSWGCSGTGGRRCMGRISLDYPNDCKFNLKLNLKHRI